ncbi:MAG: hypothetical protein ABIJ08_02885 [Nanoarchaeota archaeon]
MKRKSQITVFIILGMVLVLGLSYFIFIREKSFQEVEKIDPELLPVQSFIEACMTNVGREALNILGENGGYVYILPEIANNPQSYLQINPEQKYPYWWYDGTQRVPPLDFMEDQLMTYMNENLPTCLSGFEAFSSKFDIIGHSDISTIVEIGDSMDSLVKVEIRYDIEIKDKFNKTLAELDRFRVEVPVKLFAAYTLANNILDSENAQGFVERKVIDLITMDEEIPDTGGPKITCSKLQWNVEDIKKKLQLIMSYNLNQIKIKGTKFNPYSVISTEPIPVYHEVSPGVYKTEFVEPLYNNSYYMSHYVWDVGDEDWSNMHVSFIYDYWNLEWMNDFYIRPNKYPYLYSNSQQIGDIMSFLCMHIWHFSYDIKFPVKVVIVDDETMNNDEYKFNFAFQGSIDHLEPKRQTFSITDYQTENTIDDEEYCANTVKNDVLILAKINRTPFEEIKDVNLSFVCGRFVCYLGETKPDYTMGGIPMFRGKAPYCTSGFLRAWKEGYVDVEMYAQSTDDSTWNIYMEPLRILDNFTVVKHEDLGNGFVTPLGVELENDETALIILKAKEKDFERTKFYSPNQTIEEAIEKFELLDKDDYTYNLEIYLMKGENMTGGYKGEWEVDKDLVKIAKQVKFHVVYKDLSDEAEMAAFFLGMGSYATLVPPPELTR